MRLWSLHPKYLDPIGLARCFNEGKGGLRALKGLQKMHRTHPQLRRFGFTGDPVGALSTYLWHVYSNIPEDRITDNKYNTDVLTHFRTDLQMPVTTGQIEFEREWLNHICTTRRQAKDWTYPGRDLHPMFFEVPGGIAPWENLPKKGTTNAKA